MRRNDVYNLRYLQGLVVARFENKTSFRILAILHNLQQEFSSWYSPDLLEPEYLPYIFVSDVGLAGLPGQKYFQCF